VRFDVVIIGSGPAGCALAIHLRDAGVSVAIFTAPRRSLFDDFPETLPPGIPEGYAGLRPLYAMASAWGDSKLTIRHALCNPLGHGWFVDRAVFDREMLARATAGAVVPVRHGRLRSATRTNSGWSLCFSGQPDAVEAGFVVDASGRSSAFARLIGVRRVALDRLVCLSTKAVAVDFPAGEALVESIETGWWFSALNSSGDLSISFFSHPGCASFEDALRATIHTSNRVSGLLDARPLSRPARTDWLKTPAGEGWLAIGDAAFASDPLGSQGLLRALETAEKAAAIIAGNGPKDCETHVDYLDRFLRERKVFYESERRWPEADFWKSARAAMKETTWPK
jgi:flavin-dependent dehydrogenase